MWQRWFAWRPVRAFLIGVPPLYMAIPGDRWVWLRWIERRAADEKADTLYRMTQKR